MDNTIFYETNKNNSCTIEILKLQANIAIEWFCQWKINIDLLNTSAIMFSNRQIQACDCLKC